MLTHLNAMMTTTTTPKLSLDKKSKTLMTSATALLDHDYSTMVTDSIPSSQTAGDQQLVDYPSEYYITELNEEKAEGEEGVDYDGVMETADAVVKMEVDGGDEEEEEEMKIDDEQNLNKSKFQTPMDLSYLNDLRCSECYFVAQCEKSLLVHYESNHLQLTHHICLVCCKFFEKKHHRNAHLEYQHFWCSTCSFVGQSQEDLVIHQGASNHFKVGVEVEELSESNSKSKGKRGIVQQNTVNTTTAASNSKKSNNSSAATHKILPEPDHPITSQDDANDPPYMDNSDSNGSAWTGNNPQQQQRLYSCEKCDYVSKSQNGLDLHIQHTHILIDEELENYRCPVCGFCGKSPYDMYDHQVVEHKMRVLKCDKCSFRSETAYQAAVHYKFNHANHGYTCSLCPYQTNRYTFLNRHIKSRHSEKKFECSLCKYKASQRWCVTQHIAIVHEKRKVYQCKECNFYAPAKGNLNTHIRQKHFGCKYYTCRDCDFKSSLFNTYTSHILTHENITLRCFACKLTDKSADVILKHKDECHALKCPQCGYVGEDASLLEAHHRSSHSTGIPVNTDVYFHILDTKTGLTYSY